MDTGDTKGNNGDLYNPYKDDNTGNNTDNKGNNTDGDTTPRKIPDLAANTQFTVTLLNNEKWERKATLTIDGKAQSMVVAPNKPVSQQFTTTTGQVTIQLFSADMKPMRIPVSLVSSPLGAGKTVAFGAEKPTGEDLKGYMDVFVHIDWNTNINN
ncbi:hypothetical protein ACGVWS_14015 [Enterobacteriaceae bacterium LUAb1]